MNNYEESKQKLDEIRSKYCCAGGIIFRTAIQYVIDYGKCTLLDPGWYKCTMNDIDAKHDNADAEGKWLFCTRAFEKAIVDCAVALCDVNTYDLLTYVQREVWLGGDGISYQRAIELLKGCINYFDYDPLNQARDVGFDDDEIAELGFECLFDTEMEEE